MRFSKVKQRFVFYTENLVIPDSSTRNNVIWDTHWYKNHTTFVNTFIQCQTNVVDVGPTLYKCYTNDLFIMGIDHNCYMQDVFIQLHVGCCTCRWFDVFDHVTVEKDSDDCHGQHQYTNSSNDNEEHRRTRVFLLINWTQI